MRILFDQGTPAPLRKFLPSHEIVTAYEQGWSTLKNGDLIAAAEAEGFEIFVTTDSNLRYQQKLDGRALAIVVLMSTSWPKIQSRMPAVIAGIEAAIRGAYLEIPI